VTAAISGLLAGKPLSACSLLARKRSLALRSHSGTQTGYSEELQASRPAPL
jgi:hypothetical protein